MILCEQTQIVDEARLEGNLLEDVGTNTPSVNPAQNSKND